MGLRPRAARERRVAFVLKGYPRLSETFIAEEILEPRTSRYGSQDHVLASSDRRQDPPGPSRDPGARRVSPGISPLGAAAGAAGLSGASGRGRALVRPCVGSRPICAAMPLAIGCGASGRLACSRPSCRTMSARLHAHFIHTPASVTAYAAPITGLPWSCSAHAKDIWTSPTWDLAQKLRASSFTVTCTAAGQARLHEAAPDRPAAPGASRTEARSVHAALLCTLAPRRQRPVDAGAHP